MDDPNVPSRDNLHPARPRFQEPWHWEVYRCPQSESRVGQSAVDVSIAIPCWVDEPLMVAIHTRLSARAKAARKGTLVNARIMAGLLGRPAGVIHGAVLVPSIPVVLPGGEAVERWSIARQIEICPTGKPPTFGAAAQRLNSMMLHSKAPKAVANHLVLGHDWHRRGKGPNSPQSWRNSRGR